MINSRAVMAVLLSACALVPAGAWGQVPIPTKTSFPSPIASSSTTTTLSFPTTTTFTTTTTTPANPCKAAENGDPTYPCPSEAPKNGKDYCCFNPKTELCTKVVGEVSEDGDPVYECVSYEGCSPLLQTCSEDPLVCCQRNQGCPTPPDSSCKNDCPKDEAGVPGIPCPSADKKCCKAGVENCTYTAGADGAAGGYSCKEIIKDNRCKDRLPPVDYCPPGPGKPDGFCCAYGTYCQFNSAGESVGCCPYGKVYRDDAGVATPGCYGPNLCGDKYTSCQPGESCCGPIPEADPNTGKTVDIYECCNDSTETCGEVDGKKACLPKAAATPAPIPVSGEVQPGETPKAPGSY